MMRLTIFGGPDAVILERTVESTTMMRLTIFGGPDAGDFEKWVYKCTEIAVRILVVFERKRGVRGAQPALNPFWKSAC